MNFRLLKTIAVIGTVFLLCAIFLAGTLLVPSGGRPDQSTIIEIRQGDSLSRIAADLERRGLVKSRLVFKWGAIFLGKRRSIKSGEYEVNGKISVYSLIELLSKGITILERITVPEGLRMTEIFTVLTHSGFGRYEEYDTLSHQPEFIESLVGSRFPSLEGFLFPDTYLFSKHVAAKKVLQVMVKSFFDAVPKNYGEQARMVNLSFYEAVILASIIEKETGVASERKLIASVFHNRLNRNMKLQTDPTVIYGIHNFDGNLTRRQLRTPTAYNTYMVKGLPPTPIASPGLAALMAAVHPAKTDYLYFVAKGDGTHKFTSNYRDHRRAVAKYQKRPIKNYKSF